MSHRDDDEVRAKLWLQARGYAASRPTWLPPGRNPDFWAENEALAPPYLWAEVKSIEPDDATAVLSKYDALIASAHIPPGLRGHAMVSINPNAAEQSVRWVLKMFANHAPKFAGNKVLLAFVQQSRNERDVLRADIAAKVPEVLWVRGAGTGPIHLPAGVCRESSAEAKVVDRGGRVRLGRTFEFVEWTGRIECSLVACLDPSGRPLQSLASMSGGDSQTRVRSARALEDANGQLKIACDVRDAPGLVFLVPRSTFAHDTMIATAVYGHLTVPLTLGSSDIEQGEMYHGSDGIFRPNKNTHISTVLCLRREGAATFFPNPFAHHSIPDNAPIFTNAKRINVEFG